MITELTERLDQLNAYHSAKSSKLVHREKKTDVAASALKRSILNVHETEGSLLM